MQVIASYKSARFHYEILESIEAGIVLKGSEVKSLRTYKKISMEESYAYIRKGELFLINLHIPEYKMGFYSNHDPKASRKLLLHKKEIKKIYAKVKEKSLTLILLKLYFNKSRVKAEIALARGKKIHDKRQSLKEKDLKREISRSIKRQV